MNNSGALKCQSGLAGQQSTASRVHCWRFPLNWNGFEELGIFGFPEGV